MSDPDLPGKVIVLVFFGAFGGLLLYVGIGEGQSPVFCIGGGVLSLLIAAAALYAIFFLKPLPASGGSGTSIFDVPQLTQSIGSQLVREAPKEWRQFKFTVGPDTGPQGGYLCCIYGPNGQTFQPSHAVQMLIAQLAAKTRRQGRFTSTAVKQQNGEWSVSVEPS